MEAINVSIQVDSTLQRALLALRARELGVLLAILAPNSLKRHHPTIAAMIVYYILLLCSFKTSAEIQPRVPEIGQNVPPTAENCMDPNSQPQVAVSPPVS